MASINGASTNGDAAGAAAVDPALHSLAISISREINLVNPNDLLAKRLLDLALQNDTVQSFQKAAKTFGRFRDIFLQEVWMDARANKFTASGAKAVEAPSGGLLSRNSRGIHSTGDTDDDNGEGEHKLMLGNIVIENSEVMMPPKQAPGGLMMPGRNSSAGGLSRGSSVGSNNDSPSASPRSSSLGLDTLATQKRKERLGAGNDSGSDRENKRSRSRYDSEEDSNDSDSLGPQFKSEHVQIRYYI
jgi:hypothetical protein